MKQKNAPQEAAYFKIKFTKGIIAVCIAIYVLCVAGIGLSLWRIISEGLREFSDYIKSPFLIAVCVFCIVLVTAVLSKSQYVVTKDTLTTQYGFIKSNFTLKSVTSVLLDTNSKKLTVYFGEEFMVLSLSPDWNEKFVRALLDGNPNIDYGFTLAEPPKQDDEKKD